jgi:hypothetical protein
MMFTFGFNIGLMSLFRGIKPTKQGLRAISANSCSVSLAISKSRNAKVLARFVAIMLFALILNVSSRSNISQIVKTVVLGIAVYMVNIVFRPFASHVKPSKAAGSVSNFVDPNNSVSIWTNVSGLCAGNDFSASLFCPRKGPGFRAVVKRLAEMFKCDLVASHV